MGSPTCLVTGQAWMDLGWGPVLLWEDPTGQPPAQAAGGCLRAFWPFQYALVIGCLF